MGWQNIFLLTHKNFLTQATFEGLDTFKEQGY